MDRENEVVGEDAIPTTGIDQIWYCEHCEKRFKSESARDGHYSSHFRRSRKGIRKQYTQKKYAQNPKKKSLQSNKPQPPRRYKMGTRHLPPSSLPVITMKTKNIAPDDATQSLVSNQSNENPSVSNENPTELGSIALEEEISDSDSLSDESYPTFVTFSKPNKSEEELAEIVKTIRLWVQSTESPFNKDLLRWLSNRPFRAPNKLVNEVYIECFENIEKHSGINFQFADFYFRMLESTIKGVYYLPAKFAANEQLLKYDIEELIEKEDLQMLLVHMHITQNNGVKHSYLGTVDFDKKVITFYDTGSYLKTKLIPEDRKKMKMVSKVAHALRSGRYKTIKIVDAPKCAKGSVDCVFHTCLFAKCVVLKQDYRQLQLPCRKTILYELLRGQLV